MLANMLTRTWSDRDGTVWIILSLHRKGAPSPESWDLYMKACSDALTAANGNIRQLRGLSISDGGAPTAKQREQVNTFLSQSREGRAILAIVTVDPIVRGVIKALSWFNPQARGFSPQELPAAIDYLGLSPAQRAEFEPALAEALAEFPIESVQRAR
jgi:hypothetical protein